MRQKIKTFFNSIYRTFNKPIIIAVIKRFLFAFSCLSLFFLYQSNIETFIDTFILVNPNFSNVFLDVLFLFTSILVSILILIKILRVKYISSYVEFFISFSFLFLIWYYEEIDKWNILKLNLFDNKIEYISLIEIPILLFILSSFFNWQKKIYKKPKPKVNTNEFISDNPILEIDEDKLDSKKVANNLIKILKNENHENSFTLGLVGPWGNGKSSVINFVKEDLKNNEENNEIIIHFLPYLNHNENDIINEFFILLSNELRQYSGKVSNQLMLYSKKLTSLYKDKNIFDFLENQITKIESTSANELYNEINEHLKEIDKKIIVFVDDLDRLNEKEILQVLKLIRNTANFKNTFFVVAMDKEYILRRLKTGNDILNSNFIDKFFQLEIYLPEIDNSTLRNYFFDCLKNSNLALSDNSFEIQLNEAITNKDNLFNDYVKNMRDVKRTANQIVYDYPIFKKEIDFKDFMNFTYFKLKFPKFLKLLNEKKADFIYVDRSKGTYNLIKKETKDKPVDIIKELNEVNLFNIDFLSKYEIFHSKNTTDCINTDLSINCEEKTLLIKTLVHLFGEENTVPDIKSIKNENNFRMLMQQKIFSNYFSQSEFEQVYDDDELNKMLLNSIFRDNKLPQLINRLNFFNTNDENKIKRTIQILVTLYDKKIDFNLFEPEIVLLLETFIQRYFENNKENKTQFSDWLKKNIFDNETLLKETRLYLLGHLWASRIENEFWNLTEDYTTEKVKDLFKQYLNSLSEKLWDVQDYSVYRVYNSINNISNFRYVINSIFIDFWNKNHIELLCAQVIELDPFTKASLKITDTVDEIFGSKTNFIDFIKQHIDSDLPEIKEFIYFFDLSEITRHVGHVVFEFTKSELMKLKIKKILENPARSNYEGLDNSSQIFFVTNNQSLSNNVFENKVLIKNYNIKVLILNDQYYIISTINRKIKKEDIVNIAKVIYNKVKEDLKSGLSSVDEEQLFEKENFIPENPNNYTAKLYSVQPPIKK